MRSEAEMAEREEAAKNGRLYFFPSNCEVKYRNQSIILSVWNLRAALITGATVLTGISVLSSGLEPEPESCESSRLLSDSRVQSSVLFRNWVDYFGGFVSFVCRSVAGLQAQLSC